MQNLVPELTLVKRVLNDLGFWSTFPVLNSHSLCAAHQFCWTRWGGDVEVFNNPFDDSPEATAEAEPGATIYIRVPAVLKRRVEEAADAESGSRTKGEIIADEGSVAFAGPRPFDLPVAQRTTVTGHGNNGVRATFYSLLPKRENGVLVNRGVGTEAVNVQMLSKVARKLAEQRLRAADESERK